MTASGAQGASNGDDSVTADGRSEGQPTAWAAESAGLWRTRGSWTRVKPRVLIVDYDEDARNICATYMRNSGWEVQAVADGEEALIVASGFAPDVVVLDVRMLVLDGIDGPQAFKRDSRNKLVPIVVYTSGDKAQAPSGTLISGYPRLVPKPCAPAELSTLLEELMANQGE